MLLLLVAVAAGGYAALIAWTGGFDARVLGVRIRSHTWFRPAAAALVAAAVSAAIARARLAAAFGQGWSFVDSRGVAVVLTAAAVVWTAVACVLFSTLAVGGSDSYGYVSQARLLARGRLLDRVPMDAAFDWPLAHQTLTPLGHTPAGADGLIAPTYPPGFPLLMAPFTRLPDPAVYAVVPILGTLTVLLCYAAGRALGDPLAGAIGAVLLAASTTFLFQVFQPMSDVPAAAFWLVALLMAARGSRNTTVFAGLSASIATLIRPNLAPLSILVGALAVVQFEPRNWKSRSGAAALFCAALAPGLVLLGYIQHVRFGSLFASGYEPFGRLFSLDNIVPNLQRYPRWLTGLHTWFIWVWVAAPVWIVRQSAGVRRFAWTAYAFVVAVIGAYLPYLYFQPHEWTYTRFILPALPLMLILGAIVALSIIRSLPAVLRAPTVAVVFGMLVLILLRTADHRNTFALRGGERKYPVAGAYVRDRLPAHAFIVAAQHSGSIRYYAGKPILRWDVLPERRLDVAVNALRARGHLVFAVLDGDEYQVFYKRFDAAGQQMIHRLRLVGLPADVRVYIFD